MLTLKERPLALVPDGYDDFSCSTSASTVAVSNVRVSVGEMDARKAKVTRALHSLASSDPYANMLLFVMMYKYLASRHYTRGQKEDDHEAARRCQKAWNPPLFDPPGTKATPRQDEIQLQKFKALIEATRELGAHRARPHLKALEQPFFREALARIDNCTISKLESPPPITFQGIVNRPLSFAWGWVTKLVKGSKTGQRAAGSETQTSEVGVKEQQHPLFEGELADETRAPVDGDGVAAKASDDPKRLHSEWCTLREHRSDAFVAVDVRFDRDSWSQP